MRTLDIAGGYSIESVPPEGVAEFVMNLSKYGYIGANVTIPHKERVLNLTAPDQRARRRRRQHAVVRPRHVALDEYRY